MSLGFSLLPREDRFYDMIDELGELSFQGVELLRGLAAEAGRDDERARKLATDITAVKSRAKAVHTDMLQSLCKTFITPLDREDLHTLADGLYRIPKLVDKIQLRVMSFGLYSEEDDYANLTGRMGEAAAHVHDLIRHIRTAKDMEYVSARVALLDNIEQVADDYLATMTHSLFQRENDVKRIILRQDVYAMMEDIVDELRDVGNLILEIVLKHA